MTLLDIQKKIDEADSTYYVTGTSLIDDSEYDSLKDKLKELNPTDVRLTRVGASVRESIFTKRVHTIPMNSLDKATNKTEFKQWLTNTVGSIDSQLYASYKADGGSYSFEYQDGRLIYAVSRGDGSEGEDITANALKFKGLPRQVNIARIPFTGYVRGEVILDNDNWAIVDPEQISNPRNLGVGIASRKDGSQSELLQVLAFRIYDKNGNPLGYTEEDQEKILKNAGFNVITSCVGSFNDIWSFYEDTDKKRDTLNYWIDGIVVKLNNLKTQIELGETSHHPKGQIALKFPVLKVNTTLRKVNLQVGQTGIICPVAEFDPVRLGGATVCNATLHNWDYINKHDIAIGDTVTVIKAGDIIPKIICAPIKSKDRVLISEPTCCPTCKSPVIRKQNISGLPTAAIFCTNADCSSKQTGKITKFVSSLNIIGVGETVVETLVNEKLISDPADLFSLKLFESTLANVQFKGKVRLGEKRATLILEEIEKKRNLELAEFLGALGIPGLGRRRVEIVQAALPGEFDLLEDWLSNKLVLKANEVGLPNSAVNINTEILKNKTLIEKCLKNGIVINKPYVAPPINNIGTSSGSGTITCYGKTVHSICITGVLSNPRDYYERLIKKQGLGWDTSVKSTTTHLVVADVKAPPTTKVKAAMQKGVIIIGEADLNGILGIP